MVQPDPSSARRRPDSDRADPLVQSLEDRLLFRQAQGILVGLTDCKHAHAARSLRTTAAELGLDTAAAAERFLGALDDPGTEPARTLLLRVAVLALLPDGPAGGGGPGERDVGADCITSSTGRLSVRGVLDAPTVPLVQAGTRALSVAEVVRSGDGEGVQLDLAGLTYLDGAGLRALGVVATSVRDGGSALRVTPPRSAGLRRVLHFAVTMRWLPADFEVNPPAAPRAGGNRTPVAPAGAPPGTGRAARLAGTDAR